MNRKHAQLTALMTAYNAGDPKRIQHFIKVFQLASVIGTLEQVDEETLFVLETAAINNRQKKMGYNAAKELLIRLGLDDKMD